MFSDFKSSSNPSTNIIVLKHLSLSSSPIPFLQLLHSLPSLLLSLCCHSGSVLRLSRSAIRCTCPSKIYCPGRFVMASGNISVTQTRSYVRSFGIRFVPNLPTFSSQKSISVSLSALSVHTSFRGRT